MNIKDLNSPKVLNVSDLHDVKVVDGNVQTKNNSIYDKLPSVSKALLAFPTAAVNMAKDTYQTLGRAGATPLIQAGRGVESLVTKGRGGREDINIPTLGTFKSETKSNLPPAGESLKQAGEVLLAGKGDELLKPVLNKLSILKGVIKDKNALKHIADIESMLSPELKGVAKEKAAIKNFGAGIETKGISREITFKPTKEASILSEELKNVIDPKKLPSENQQALGKHIKTVETSLNNLLEKYPQKISHDTYNIKIGGLKNNIPRGFKGNDEAAYNNVIDFSKELFSKKEQTVKGLREAREELDYAFKDQYPNAYKNGKIDETSPFARAYKAVRDKMNAYQYERLGKFTENVGGKKIEAGIGKQMQDLIQKEADLFRANELLGKTTTKQIGSTFLKRTTEAYPKTTKLLKVGGTIGGLGAAGKQFYDIFR